MIVHSTAIPDVVILEPRLFRDDRGYFFESFSQQEFNRLVRPIDFVQDNESCSTRGVMRGLHYQRMPHTQSKLVRCTRGCVLDVAVDIRQGSPTFGQHVAVELSEDNHLQQVRQLLCSRVRCRHLTPRRASRHRLAHAHCRRHLECQRPAPPSPCRCSPRLHLGRGVVLSTLSPSPIGSDKRRIPCLSAHQSSRLSVPPLLLRLLLNAISKTRHSTSGCRVFFVPFTQGKKESGCKKASDSPICLFDNGCIVSVPCT